MVDMDHRLDRKYGEARSAWDGRIVLNLSEREEKTIRWFRRVAVTAAVVFLVVGVAMSWS